MSRLEEAYKQRYERFLVPVANKLESHIRECLLPCERIDRICARAKSVSRFMEKAQKEEGQARYSEPLDQIQDQLGARIVTFYSSDVPRIACTIKKYFRPIEDQKLIPDGENEFGYIGQHFIMLIPSDVFAGIQGGEEGPTYFELQIKTLFQHAWAEAEHDLGYKPEKPLTSLQKRKVAFTAAQAWGADQIFDELFNELNPASE